MNFLAEAAAEPIDAITLAVMISIAIMAITDYLIEPIRQFPKATTFLLKIGLAYYKLESTEITIWIIPYITFLLGVGGSYAFGVDLFSSYVPGREWATRLLTAALVGGGSKVIHSVISNTKKS